MQSVRTRPRFTNIAVGLPFFPYVAPFEYDFHIEEHPKDPEATGQDHKSHHSRRQDSDEEEEETESNDSGSGDGDKVVELIETICYLVQEGELGVLYVGGLLQGEEVDEEENESGEQKKQEENERGKVGARAAGIGDGPDATQIRDIAVLMGTRLLHGTRMYCLPWQYEYINKFWLLNIMQEWQSSPAYCTDE